MIESHIRAKLQPYFNHAGAQIAHLSPNHITMAAFITGITSGIFLSADYRMIALALLLASGVLDVLDGTVARLNNQSHPAGAYMDLISDRMVECAMILGFTVSYPHYYFAYILFLISVLLHFATFVAAGALFKNEGHKSMHHDHSFIERAEAFIVFILMLLFPAYIFELLTLFSVAIIADAVGRFSRVIKNAG